MSSESARTQRNVEFLLTDPRVALVLMVAYVAIGMVFVRTDYAMHDEGLLTHYWASWARRDFAPVFFFQKVKPVLTVLYLPFTAWGVHATLAVHVLVSSLAIPMISATARALGQRLPNLAGILVAFSPIFFFGGATGLSNIDGAVGVILVLFLLAAGRAPLAAGLVAGTLPWVRFELAVFCFTMAVYALVTPRDRRFLVGLVVFPVLYTIAGGLYHGDLLWLAHFPPSAPFDPSDPIHRYMRVGLRWFFEPALALTPVAALVAALPVLKLSRLEKAVLVYAALASAAVHVLPIFTIGNFGDSPRYSIHVLPALALLVGRSVEPWWEGSRLPWTRIAAVAGLALWLTTRQADERIVVPLMAAYLVIMASARFASPALALTLVVALAAAGPLLPVRAETTRAVMAPYLDPMAHWILSHPAEAQTPIYTNSQLLAPYLEGRGRPPGTVYFLPGKATRREEMLANPANGQRDSLRRLAAADLYGKLIAGQVAPDDLPRGALLAMRKSSRLSALFPEELWGSRVEVLDDSPLHRIARMR